VIHTGLRAAEMSPISIQCSAMALPMLAMVRFVQSDSGSQSMVRQAALMPQECQLWRSAATCHAS
jgi:hypothetical protein